MDTRLLHHYNTELDFMRDMGAEFARHFPKVAGRLGMEGLECADPYVERMLEGFAFLTARVHLKIEEEYPKFCQHLLEIVYPDYLAPLPSMTVVQLQPDCSDPDLAKGQVIERGASIESGLGQNMQTPCEYRTSHDVKLFPVTVVDADYLGTRAALANLGIKPTRQVSAGLRIGIEVAKGVDVSDLKMKELPIFIGGSGTIPTALLEHVLAGVCGFSVMTGDKKDRQVFSLSRDNVCAFGFEPEQALLNYQSRSFEGYRLLREYFAFPERFRFINFTGLDRALPKGTGQRFDLIVHLDTRNSDLENVIGKNNFLPFCVPAINLFPKRADRITLNNIDHEFHVLADRSRPLDYEVHQVLAVAGYGKQAEERKQFLPFYGLTDAHIPAENSAFYAVHRKSRLLSSRQHSSGARSGYLGQEVFISLVDAEEAPYSTKLAQLGVKTMCSNRDLPMQIPLGQKDGDFTLTFNAPVEKIRCVAGPTRPRTQVTTGDYVWRIINHLSLNFLSLIDDNPDEGAAALRELLQLYTKGDTVGERQINGLLSVTAKAVTRRLPIPGPISFGRGLEIKMVLDETAFEAGGMYLFGSVMSEFFRKYVSINHVTEVIVLTDSKTEVARWAVKAGLRPQL
ncbi:MAG: type VI secretion system baseplate subunit TssF [Lysobacterales bacterium]